MALCSTQPLTEMSTRNIPGMFFGVKGGRVIGLTLPPSTDCLENVGATTSHNLMGLHDLLQGYLYFYFTLCPGFTQTLIDATKEVRLEVNTEKTKYMLLSSHQNAGQNQDIKIRNIRFKNVVKKK
jgi:hypothetical protein